MAGCSPQSEGEEEEEEEGWELTSSSIWEGELLVVPQAAPARAWVWWEAGEVAVPGSSGMFLVNTQGVIPARARGRRDEIPPIQPSLAGSGGSEMLGLPRGIIP